MGLFRNIHGTSRVRNWSLLGNKSVKNGKNVVASSATGQIMFSSGSASAAAGTPGLNYGQTENAIHVARSASFIIMS